MLLRIEFGVLVFIFFGMMLGDAVLAYKAGRYAFAVLDVFLAVAIADRYWCHWRYWAKRK